MSNVKGFICGLMGLLIILAVCVPLAVFVDGAFTILAVFGSIMMAVLMAAAGGSYLADGWSK